MVNVIFTLKALSSERPTTYSAQTQNEMALKSMISQRLFHKATSDVDIVVSGGTAGAVAVRIPAHKLIPSLASPVFTAMFENQLLESLTNEIVISDFSEEVVRAMLHCIYDSEAIHFEVEHHAEDLLSIANKYQLSAIENTAMQYIAANITVDNAIETLVNADKYDRSQIKTAAMKFIVWHQSTFFKMPDFAGLLGVTLVNEFFAFMCDNNCVK